MQLNQLLEKIPFLNRANDLLVCEVDALGMRGAVFVRERDGLSLALEAHADADDLMEAVAELVDKLRKQGWVGKQAVLLSPAVVQQLIELPIAPKNKLAPQQIADSVRWELEPFLSQQTRHLSIGQLLLQNRYIQAEQIEEIVSEQQASSMQQSRQMEYQQFGEMAVEKRYATQMQVDKALKRQAWFITTSKNASSDDIQCGWAAQSPMMNPDTQQFSWLVVGMSKPLLRQWQAAFSAQAVKLLGAYPLTGNAIGGLALVAKAEKNNADEAFDELVFEVHEAQLTGAHLQNGLLKASHTSALTAGQMLSALSDMAQSFAVDHVQRLTLIDAFSRSEKELNQLAQDIQVALAQPVSVLARLGHSTHLGLKIAAQHALQQKTSISIAMVPVGEPLLPLMQRPEIRMVIGGLVIVSLIGVTELSLLARKYSLESEKETVDKELAKVNAAIAVVQAKVDQAKKLQESIKAKQEALKKAESNVNLISHDLPKRNDLIKNLLTELSRTVSDEVVIERIEEDTVLGFTLTAWSMNDKSAQEFVKNFQVAIHPLGYRLKDITITEQIGRLSLLGNAINFNATKLTEEEYQAAKLKLPLTAAKPNNSTKAGQ